MLRFETGWGPGLVAIGFLMPFTIGLLAGIVFGRRERDVAFPMPIATAVAALGVGLVVGWPMVVVVFAIAGKISP